VFLDRIRGGRENISRQGGNSSNPAGRPLARCHSSAKGSGRRLVAIPTTELDDSSCSTMHGIWLPTRQFSDTLSATAQMPIATPLQDVKSASRLPSASKPLADLHDRASEIKRLHTLHLQYMQRHRHNFLSTRPGRHREGSMVSHVRI